MSLEIYNNETNHSKITNNVTVEGCNVYQTIVHTKDIQSERQLEYLIDKLITQDGFIPETKADVIVFSKNMSDDSYVIYKDSMVIEKVKKVLIGPLEDM